MILKERIVKKTRKVHYCNSWEWLRNEDISRDEFTSEEYEDIMKAKNNNGKIEIGSSCLYSVGISNGEFWYCYSIPELHDICIKYEIYQD